MRHIRSDAGGRLLTVGLEGMLAASMLVGGCKGATAVSAESRQAAAQLARQPFPADSVATVELFVVRVDSRGSSADTVRYAESSGARALGQRWTTIATPNQIVNWFGSDESGAATSSGTSEAPADYLEVRVVIDPARSRLTLKNGTVVTGFVPAGDGISVDSVSGIELVLAHAPAASPAARAAMLVRYTVLSGAGAEPIARDRLLFSSASGLRSASGPANIRTLDLRADRSVRK